MGHTEGFIHARSNGVNRGSTTNFIFEFWTKFFASRDDFFTFFAIWIPSIFGFGASFLTEGGKSNLREAVFDDFVTRGEFVFFPVAKFLGGLLDGGSDFGDLFVCEGIIIDLFPIFLLDVVAVVLSALSDKKMQVTKLLWGGVW